MFAIDWDIVLQAWKPYEAWAAVHEALPCSWETPRDNEAGVWISWKALFGTFQTFRFLTYRIA